ncbi:MAG: ACP S-malonyltransferase [Chitinophagales bacterium]|nr:ACP S-malonyltransferase [Chitinophagales bacterium]
MKAYVFPGQGAQFEGMGKDIYEEFEAARLIFNQADEILGYKLSEIMFYGTAEELKETKVTQPALFVHAIATLSAKGNTEPNAVAGHSLGEFSALVANGTLSFEDGLRLVYARAMAMQAACDAIPGTMAAVLGLEDHIVEQICEEATGIVAPANYNCPGQLVISGSIEGVNEAMVKLQEAGARRVLQLEVGGAFHSPLMEPARMSLANAIMNTTFHQPKCPVYQNVTGLSESDPDKIKSNLIAQLTGSVRWTQSIEKMIKDGMDTFIEVGGSGKVLSGLIKKIDRSANTETL